MGEGKEWEGVNYRESGNPSYRDVIGISEVITLNLWAFLSEGRLVAGWESGMGSKGR